MVNPTSSWCWLNPRLSPSLELESVVIREWTSEIFEMRKVVKKYEEVRNPPMYQTGRGVRDMNDETRERTFSVMEEVAVA